MTLVEVNLERYHGFWVRPVGQGGRGDRLIINETDYAALSIGPDDVVLDVGANIGTFAKRAALAGARVISYEPDPDNFELLQLNTTGLDVVARRAAVVGTGAQSEATFYRANHPDWPMMHSTQARRGRTDTITVAAACFATVVAALQPTVVKIDIEGGEYELLDDLVPWPSSVRELAVEFHYGRKRWRELAGWVLAQWHAQGAVFLREPVLGKRWSEVAVMTRGGTT